MAVVDNTLEANALTQEDRDRLILEHLPQVRLIAQRVHEKIQGRVDLDDLVSAGTVGLIAAVDHFDPTRDLQLKTYAEYKIRGAILDALRSLDGLSRDNRKRTKAIGAARNAAEQRLKRAATHDEVAQEVGVTLKEYSDTLTSPGAGAPFSLDATVGGPAGELKFSELIAGPATDSPEEELAQTELKAFVSGAIAALEPTQKSVITLHYAHGLTMRKIAPILSLSEWQVQEARRQAIRELRFHLVQAGVAESALTN
jgi:RNA polymerase sigma factor for flagellar operon FliA